MKQLHVKTGRPVGIRIRTLLQETDRLGSATTRQLSDATGIDMPNVGKYCLRAVGMGFMEVDRTARPHIYRASEGWMDRISISPLTTPPPEDSGPPEPLVAHALRTQPNSVFAMGGWGG